MSKDITSYFTVLSKTKAGGISAIDKGKKRSTSSDDRNEEESVSPAKYCKSNKQLGKRKILSDSEDEIAENKRKIEKARSPNRNRTVHQSNVSTSKSSKKQRELTKHSKKRQILSDSEDEVAQVKQNSENTQSVDSSKVTSKKTVSAADVFANRPVKRSAAPKLKKKADEVRGSFCDEDLVTALDELEKFETKQNLIKQSADKTDKSNNDKEKPTAKFISDEVDSTKGESGTCKVLNSDESHDGTVKEGDEMSHGNKALEKKKRKEKSCENFEGNKIADDKPYERGISKIEVNNIARQKRKRTQEDEDPYEAAIKKKKQHLALYQQYLQRGGARNPGSKKIPMGDENCLAGLTFVITGVLDSLEREEADELIKKYGGRVVPQVSKKTDYIVAGDEPGPSKMKKAQDLGIKLLSEDDLLELIGTRPAGDVTVSIDNKSRPVNVRKQPSKARQKTPESEPLTVTKHATSPRAERGSNLKSKFFDTERQPSSVQSTSPVETSEVSSKANIPLAAPVPCETESQVWVEKYKPKSIKQIIGQQGEKSVAQKLYNWLKNWQKNQNGSIKLTRPSPWAQHDGSFFKAALLSGPPGVGKTTTVQLVCQALQLDALEFNASDTRSKRLLKEEVSELLNNKSMKSYFLGGNNKKPALDHVLVMDEVDGMAGNEDRGGLQELIALIKTTNVPIICICNDRNHPKMRTLANYTYDLRFQKPKLQQIKSAMLSICCKEKIDISKDDLDRLIESTNNDVRQVLNHLSLLANNPSLDEQSKTRRVNKDLRLGPWDVVQKVFSHEAHKNMSIHDKSDLFFHDYNIAPLFVQENYLNVIPNCPKDMVLETVAKTAESLALGDLAENSIRRNNTWALLPVQAFYSSVIPGTLMSGHISRQIMFPSWLGQNSKRGKFDRLLQEITLHTRLATASSKDAINLDYLKHLRDAILRPLATDGSNGNALTLETMNFYHLLREDLDLLVEVSLWPGQRDPMQALDSKVKAAFTRAFNKSAIMRPYAFTKGANGKKKRAQITFDDDDGLNLEEELESEEDDESPSSDPMIKVKEVPATSGKKTTGTVEKKAAGSKKKKSSNPRAGKSKVK